ncbi:AAA family ATPase [Sphingobacterium sp.]|uniref:AAA family ATPase n=1 Tax=Sphingobacterium sp. TaxID=341027 RepID=UPI0031DFF754
MTPISDIHQEVFDMLLKYYKIDNDFLYVMRHLNRGGRLDKGYWFLGNDYYVSVSFWAGLDKKTRSPRVSFVILGDGTTYLELNNTSSINFFSMYFLTELKFTSENYGVYRKDFSEYGKDYLSSLEAFIHNEKLQIDKYVRNKSHQYDNILEVGGIDFVWPNTFNYQLEKIRGYQKVRKEKARKTGYLRYLNIKKFGKIENLIIKDIPVGCRWIFLTGENGAGKTTILRALASAMLNNNDHENAVSKDDNEFNVQIGLETINGVSKTTVKGSNDFRNKEKLVKGFATYGPVRLISQGTLVDDLINLDKNGISLLYTYGLFNPIGILRDISGSYILNVRPKYYEIELHRFLENIEQNLEIILPNVQKVNVVMSDKGREILYHQGKPVPGGITEGVKFNELPSGTRNFAALILDLLLRFAEQQGDVADISNYVGIVLIDEIDLHLHPKMQKEIIIQLAETFPNIQFIVTTHSPIPLLGAPSNSIFINVTKNEKNEICAKKLDIDISNLLPNTILTSPIFNFEELINENHDHTQPLITEDDFTDAMFYKILEKKIKENSIKPLQ